MNMHILLIAACDFLGAGPNCMSRRDYSLPSDVVVMLPKRLLKTSRRTEKLKTHRKVIPS